MRLANNSSAALQGGIHKRFLSEQRKINNAFRVEDGTSVGEGDPIFAAEVQEEEEELCL